jgi:hypothetical protein
MRSNCEMIYTTNLVHYIYEVCTTISIRGSLAVTHHHQLISNLVCT